MKTQTATLIAGGAVLLAIGGVVVFYGRLKDINKGTPYEGSGAVGTVGNITNQVLGGIPQKLGEALGSGLYEAFHDDDAGDDVYHIVTFPDGEKHAISSGAVNDKGRFTYAGTTYALVLRKDGTGGRYFAVIP